MAKMFEGGGYGLGLLQLAGNCKKCKSLAMVTVDVTKSIE